MLTTRFKVWLQDPHIAPEWTGVTLVDLQDLQVGCIEVMVEGTGYDLQRLIANRQDIFAAYLQMKPERQDQ